MLTAAANLNSPSVSFLDSFIEINFVSWLMYPSISVTYEGYDVLPPNRSFKPLQLLLCYYDLLVNGVRLSGLSFLGVFSFIQTESGFDCLQSTACFARGSGPQPCPIPSQWIAAGVLHRIQDSVSFVIYTLFSKLKWKFRSF